MSARVSAPATWSSHRPHLAVSAPISTWIALRPPSSASSVLPSQGPIRTLAPRSFAARTSHLKRSRGTRDQSLIVPSPWSSRSHICDPSRSRRASESHSGKAARGSYLPPIRNSPLHTFPHEVPRVSSGVGHPRYRRKHRDPVERCVWRGEEARVFC